MNFNHEQDNNNKYDFLSLRAEFQVDACGLFVRLHFQYTSEINGQKVLGDYPYSPSQFEMGMSSGIDLIRLINNLNLTYKNKKD